MIIATLFEALASAAGSPIKISNGRVKREPPPATVLMNPAAMPVLIKNTYSEKAMI